VIGWLIGGGYILVVVAFTRRMAWEIAGSASYGRIDGEDLVFGLIFGVAISLIWPVAIPVYMIYRLAQTKRGFKVATRLVFSMPRDVRERDELERQERDLREREWEIQRMERELGIKV
jgi:hypothetical protein